MSFSAPTTYIPRQSPLHALDARVKLVLLLAYSISLFFLNTWAGLGLAAAALVATVALGRLPVRPLLAPLVPLYVLVAVTVVLNCLNGGGGNPGFDAQRMLAALMVGVRILLLAWASLAVTYSTASNQLMEAFASFLHPLRKLGAPVDDVALTLSLALRFIPLVAQQMEAVRHAQYSRGAAFDAGALAAIKAWGGTLVPVLVGMFRRGEVLATSMEARCYGAPGPRTRLASNPFTPANALVAIAGLAGCVCACLFL